MSSAWLMLYARSIARRNTAHHLPADARCAVSQVFLRRLDLRQITVGMLPGIQEFAIGLDSLGMLAFLVPSQGDAVQRKSGVRASDQRLTECRARFLEAPGTRTHCAQ